MDKVFIEDLARCILDKEFHFKIEICSTYLVTNREIINCN